MCIRCQELPSTGLPPAPRVAARRAMAIALVLAASAVHAEKTVTYYQDNAGERMDPLLACADGAEPPTSLGCRNAMAAQEKDKRLASQFQGEVALSQWDTGESAKGTKLKAASVLQSFRAGVVNAACVALSEGKEPARPYGQKILKTSLAEKFIEALPAKSHMYRITKRGEEFLRAQQHSAKIGHFCPMDIQFAAQPKLLEVQDMAVQYKGRRSAAGLEVRTLRVSKISFELANTSASAWFARKVVPDALPTTGQAVGQFVTVEYVNRKGATSWGQIHEIDGKLVAKPDVEKLLAVFK